MLHLQIILVFYDSLLNRILILIKLTHIMKHRYSKHVVNINIKIYHIFFPMVQTQQLQTMIRKPVFLHMHKTMNLFSLSSKNLFHMAETSKLKISICILYSMQHVNLVIMHSFVFPLTMDLIQMLKMIHKTQHFHYYVLNPILLFPSKNLLRVIMVLILITKTINPNPFYYRHQRFIVIQSLNISFHMGLISIPPIHMVPQFSTNHPDPVSHLLSSLSHMVQTSLLPMIITKRFFIVHVNHQLLHGYSNSLLRKAMTHPQHKRMETLHFMHYVFKKISLFFNTYSPLVLILMRKVTKDTLHFTLHPLKVIMTLLNTFLNIKRMFMIETMKMRFHCIRHLITS